MSVDKEGTEDHYAAGYEEKNSEPTGCDAPDWWAW